MKNRASLFRAALIVSASALAMSACASKPVPPPEISYDAADFKTAVIEKAPDKPVRIVEVPKPLPLPGQLQPEPGKAAEDKRSPTERVVDANKAATQEPTKHGYVNAVQVYPYAEGALYQLYAAPERVTDVALQPGETLTSVSAGDTVRWVIGDTVSGSGDNQRTHVLVKPFAPGLKTNLVVTTDRRSYHLQLESTEKTAMAAISWTYSEDQIIALRRRNAEAEAAMPMASNVALDDIRFRYSITGDTPPWRPVRAFDDGHKVYIEFPRRIDQGEAPPLFVVGAKGDNQLVNYRMRGNYYVVDRLFAAAELRLGTEPQQVVRITRSDGKPRRRPSLFGRSGR
ncbi:P-type conjugative transfer protein TrbG [Allomesorhizobium camelthorni]|uniref:P-type conjugative transfer protein TrbG n=1 Tax=Allomesorhizobium camelthorni TaxID=475069 RepID=A0A6G4WEJ7_9HYPH|nr:P-type conjugative transfer protein TrbG [Mesorhizobium camelthorni]NGO53029.1 P-type conjugative transfer protein TrbG [Mesorhizobium camelthorni]